MHDDKRIYSAFHKAKESSASSDRNNLQKPFPHSWLMGFFPVPQELYQSKLWNGSTIGFVNSAVILE